MGNKTYTIQKREDLSWQKWKSISFVKDISNVINGNVEKVLFKENQSSILNAVSGYNNNNFIQGIYISSVANLSDFHLKKLPSL